MMRIRAAIYTIVFLFATFSLNSQVLDPVKWTVSIENVEGDDFEIIYHADIDEHWHLYSQHMDPDKIGPIPTTFALEPSEDYDLVGETEEPEAIIDYDPNFEMELGFFEESVDFRQKIRSKVGEDIRIQGSIEFMTCDDSKCIFPDPHIFDITYGQDAALDMSSGGDGHGAEGGILDPVDWSWSSEKTGDNEYTVTFKAEIEPHWHLYSQHLESQFGPVPTSFSFADSTDGYTLVGPTTEGTPEKSWDPNFEMELSYYETEAIFQQKIETGPGSNGQVNGFLTFMVCDDSKCLPPEDIDFKIDLTTGKAILPVETGDAGTIPTGDGRFTLPNVVLDDPIQDCVARSETQGTNSLWLLFFLGFGGGLIALLTPCVFPMIPLTVSFFTKGSEDKKKGLKNALTYGFFIFLIYILLSLPFHLMDNISPDILNDISTNVPLNIFFFLIFLFFAFSFFGYYEITLPSSFTNKMDDKASSAGGLLGIFFMALTLALVSFSCTGPILGSLLAGSLSSDGGAIQLTAGMGGFGMALALPFALFAAFPGWMNSLPQSGGWLNSVKVVLGFAEVALAFKFLSNADLVSHWGLLKYETFMIIWILCAVGIVLYLLGKIRFPHDSPVQKFGFGRVFFITLFAVSSVYLATGFMYNEETHTYKSKALMSGLAPPAGYSYLYPLDCPHSLNCFHDYYEGMAYAQKVNKPVLLDFTGYACVNCRKMEEHVWDKPGVFDLIEQDYVLISLYVDDKEELPEEEQGSYTTKIGKKRNLKTYGNKWSTLQTENFNNNSQPYYVLLSPEGELLTNPVGYTPDVAEYKGFLECGLQANEQLITQN